MGREKQENSFRTLRDRIRTLKAMLKTADPSEKDNILQELAEKQELLKAKQAREFVNSIAEETPYEPASEPTEEDTQGATAEETESETTEEDTTEENALFAAIQRQIQEEKERQQAAAEPPADEEAENVPPPPSEEIYTPENATEETLKDAVKETAEEVQGDTFEMFLDGALFSSIITQATDTVYGKLYPKLYLSHKFTATERKTLSKLDWLQTRKKFKLEELTEEEFFTYQKYTQFLIYEKEAPLTNREREDLEKALNVYFKNKKIQIKPETGILAILLMSSLKRLYGVYDEDVAAAMTGGLDKVFDLLGRWTTKAEDAKHEHSTPE